MKEFWTKRAVSVIHAVLNVCSDEADDALL